MAILKWYGGKTQLIPDLMELFPNMKDIKGYCEPFLGGASVFFYLSEHGYLENKPVFLSDINEQLINTYLVVRNNLDELIPLLKEHEKNNNEKYFYGIRDSFSGNLNEVSRASCFIYMNKACFNGQWRVNNKGKINIGYGQKENIYLTDSENLNNLIECSNALKKAKIGVMSFENIVNFPEFGINLKDFLVYLDPIYDNIGDEGKSFDKYVMNWNEKRSLLKKVFSELDEMGARVVMSNSSTPWIMSEFKDYHFTLLKAKRMCAGDPKFRKIVDEVVITNYKPIKKQQSLYDF